MACKRVATDPWEGFKFNIGGKETPEDFLFDEEKGVRRKGKNLQGEWIYEALAPKGTVKIDLTDGVPTYVTLPPVSIWDDGVWLSDLPDDFEPNVDKNDRWQTWVVDGEGTPSNYAHRLYILPYEKASEVNPSHPIRWSKSLREGEKKTFSSYTSPKAPALPLKLRIRCQGCGHWYSENDLKDHITSACPGAQGGSTEWLIPCECCRELEMTSLCKEGFPRKPKLDEALKDEAQHSVKVA